MRNYWLFRDELSIEDGLVLKSERVIIPQTLRKDYMTATHEGHQGVTRCQARAQSCVYWPGISRKIEDYISTCLPCQTNQPRQKKETMEPIDTPSIPWHTISADLFTHQNNKYLLIADYHSKYPIAEKLNDMSSQAVTHLMDKIIGLFGVPNTIITDNGPQFIGQSFQKMIKQRHINHITSSPHYPRSHGFIERMVRTVKCLIKKSPNDTNTALLNYMATPLNSTRALKFCSGERYRVIYQCMFGDRRMTQHVKSKHKKATKVLSSITQVPKN